MKVHWLNLKVIFSFLCVLLMLDFYGYSDAQENLLTRKEALIVAESTEEVELFYTIYNGRLKNCINKEVVKPCESDWVTCIEDAWVVQFTVGAVCPIDHDGRLGITILVDAITGRVISRFPEAEYFREEAYCLEDYDCVSSVDLEAGLMCQNFIFGQIDQSVVDQSSSCRCSENNCVQVLNP